MNMDSWLAEVEMNPEAWHNLAAVEAALERGNTSDWAIAEATTVRLHELLGFSTPESANTMRVESALRHLGESKRKEAAALAASVVRKLQGGAKPVTARPFWETYFTLLDLPREFRVVPRPFDPQDLPESWESVTRLREARQVHAASVLAGQLSGPAPEQEQLEAAVARMRAAEARLAQGLERNDAPAIQSALLELDQVAIDSPAAMEAKGVYPVLRREWENTENTENTEEEAPLERAPWKRWALAVLALLLIVALVLALVL